MKLLRATPGPFSWSGKLRFLIAALRDAALKRVDCAVLSCLVDHAHPGKGETFVSLATMREEAGVPRQTAIRSIERLVAAGWVQVDKRPGTSTVYRLTRPAAGTGTSPAAGTGSWAPTGTTSGLRRGRTGTGGGTTPVPPPVPEQEEQEEQEQQEELSLAALAAQTDTRNRFDEFWTAYPRKVGGTEKARKSWARQKLDGAADLIIAEVKLRALIDPQWSDVQFIPHPTTFLNNQRWTDQWQVGRLARLPGESVADLVERIRSEAEAQRIAKLSAVDQVAAHIRQRNDSRLVERSTLTEDEMIAVMERHAP